MPARITISPSITHRNVNLGPGNLAEVDLLRVQGMVRGRQERWQEAWAALDESVRLAQRMPDPYRELRARAEAGTLAVRIGNVGQAQEQLQQALVIAERLRALPYIHRLRQSLESLARV